MIQPRSLGMLVSVVLATFAGMTISNGQSIPLAQNPAQAPSKLQAASSVTLRECEGTNNNCATWTFFGSQGNGQWSTGEIAGELANLTLSRQDDKTIVISRVDTAGPLAGLKANYTGTREDDGIGGTFESSRLGDGPGQHWVKKTGHWSATDAAAPMSLPTVMHWCIDVGCANGKGGMLIWENGHYLALNDVPGQTTIFVVESFTRQSVVIRRIMTGRYPGTAVLTGQLSEQGNSIVNGFQTYPNGQPRPFRAAWGAAIDTVPGPPPPGQSQSVAAQTEQANQNAGLLMLLLLGAMSGGTATGNDPPGACPGQNCSVVCPGDPNNHTGLCH